MINVSEGREVAPFVVAAGGALLDVHSDVHHNRSVLTLAGPEVEAAARAVAAAAVERLDIRSHQGVHPRIGVVDVVPFVPLAGSTMADALLARDRFAAWCLAELGLPCLVYGPERTLPEIRREAAHLGPAHPTAGRCAVGARPVLVAYNVWLAPPATVDDARRIAAAVRGRHVRALGFDVGGAPQVSCNLIEPAAVGPGALVDAVASRAAVARTELVGLVSASVLHAEPPSCWPALDLDPSRTIEARLERAGLDGGSG